MPKNQNKPRTKKYRRDRNHAESLENIDFSSIIKINSIILVYYPQADVRGSFLFLLISVLFDKLLEMPALMVEILIYVIT